MIEIPEKIKYWLSPDTDEAIDKEIDSLNLATVHYTALIVFSVQLISLIVFAISPLSDLHKWESMTTVISVGTSLVFCAGAFFFSGAARSGWILKKSTHIKVNLFIGVFLIMLLLWGMHVSYRHYRNGEQIVTFYTVVLLAIVFVRMRPSFSIPAVFGSFTFYYIYLNYFVDENKINPYNFFTLAAFSVAGAIINYRLSVNYIHEKNKTEELNKSLEYIASHDSLTKLQNRYALTRDIPTYIKNSVCIAMGDINGFKTVNDTLGHKTGDDILARFSNLLSEQFDHENIYRYGGDEFLIVAPECSVEEVSLKLAEVNKRFENIRIGNYIGKFGCSFGYAEGTPQTNYEFLNLLMSADKQLYTEKSKIKPTVKESSKKEEKEFRGSQYNNTYTS